MYLLIYSTAATPEADNLFKATDTLKAEDSKFIE